MDWIVIVCVPGSRWSLPIRISLGRATQLRVSAFSVDAVKAFTRNPRHSLFFSTIFVAASLRSALATVLTKIVPDFSSRLRRAIASRSWAFAGLITRLSAMIHIGDTPDVCGSNRGIATRSQ